MSARHIINQDRDHIYRFSADALIYTAPVIYEGLCLGYNLMLGSSFLGTFESAEDAVKEVSNILNHPGDFYAVSGYSERGVD